MMSNDFEARVQQMLIEEARGKDETRRTEAGALIIDVAQLIRDLVRFMPTFDTELEQKRYLEAVADISIQINAVSMQHDTATGELRRGGPTVSLLPGELIADGMKARFSKDDSEGSR